VLGGASRVGEGVGESGRWIGWDRIRGGERGFGKGEGFCKG